jgi:hypothetical protein
LADEVDDGEKASLGGRLHICVLYCEECDFIIFSVLHMRLTRSIYAAALSSWFLFNRPAALCS